MVGFIICIKLYLLSRYIDINMTFEHLSPRISDGNMSYFCRMDYGWKTYNKNTPVSITSNVNPCRVFISVSSKAKILNAELIGLSLNYGETIYEVNKYQIEGSSNAEKNKYYLEIMKIPVPFEDGKIIKVKYKIKVIEKELEAKFKCVRKLETGHKIIQTMMGV